ncbi:MAG: hypothetical protein IJ565_01135 [Bacilli bacterium]|nr:hypothetical protein [Bacilli bacterium]
MEVRNFVLLTNRDEKVSFRWEEDLNVLPNDTISFKHIRQTDNGVDVADYIIGVPVKYVMSDMLLKLTQSDETSKDVCCLYTDGTNQKIYGVDSNTTIVNNYNELQQAYYNELEKSNTKGTR